LVKKGKNSFWKINTTIRNPAYPVKIIAKNKIR